MALKRIVETAEKPRAETDFCAWLETQAMALRNRQPKSLDWDDLAEELEAMAARQRNELASHLKNLLVHLLKWKYQPARRSGSWATTIDNARDAIDDLLEESPSLRGKSSQALSKAYPRALRDARRETQGGVQFPASCPWDFDTIIQDGFWPD